MKQLVIAEKPSVARDLASALGKFKKEKDYFENESYIITSALGHLVELFMPEDIDPKLKTWKPDFLPILPEKFKLKAISRTKDRFSLLKKLINRDDVEGLINACDAGREGELIFAYIYELSKTKKPFSRLWLMSMTPAAIRKAFEDLKPGNEMKHLEDAARCRSESDWIIGINGTRIITHKMSAGRGRGVNSVGRVQTPTLSMVVQREQDIRNFKPQTYWRIEGLFGIDQGEYKGVYQRADFKKGDNPHDRIDRIWTKKDAEAVVAEVDGKKALVEEKKKRTKQIAPRLYDLTTLQREANSRFSFSAKSTLSIAQALYEKHKVLTYPRTDSKALPEDYVAACYKALKFLPDEYKSFAETIEDNHWVSNKNKRVFNNKEVSDHFAIIPTDQTPHNLSPQEQKIYDMVVRRFLAAFYPAAEYDVTTRLSQIDAHTFKTEGKVLAKPGWLEVHGRTSGGADELPALSEADGTPPEAELKKADLIEDVTKPPPRYTEATLLSAMEGAGKLVEDDELAEAMKERGLGTPATRAQIIEHLIALKYIDREKKDLFSTAKAEDVIEFLKVAKIEDLTSPSMTGEWEFKLRQIQEGKFSRKAFMEEIGKLAKKIVENTMLFKESTEAPRLANVIAPTDGKPFLDTFNAFKSQDGKFTIYKTIGNRRMEEKEIQKLVTERKVGPLEGFRSKYGKPYVATLELDDANKVRFVFDNADKSFDTTQVDIPTEEELKAYDVLGECPCCKKGKVYESPNAYICEGYVKNDKCKFRITRTLLSRQIPQEQFIKLIKDGKTDLIDKFRSKRTGKYFSAILILKKDGQIGFEFPKKEKKESS